MHCFFFHPVLYGLNKPPPQWLRRSRSFFLNAQTDKALTAFNLPYNRQYSRSLNVTKVSAFLAMWKN